MIAEAAHELGLDGLTLRAVADRLDVSIAALYHHVSGKEDLMRLAAEYAAAAVPIPRDTGQHWAVWLQEWATYNHDIFLARPALLAQYLDGAISVESIATDVDRILGVLVRQGFSIVDANAAYELVSACALGSAVITTRERTAIESGASLRAALRGDRRGLSRSRPPLRRGAARGAPAHRSPRTARARHHRAARHRGEQGIDWASVEAALAEAAQR